jgi:hypothetical protein
VEEGELVLIITKDFFFHDLALYQHTTVLLADQIVQKVVRMNRQLVALPLTKPEDVGIPKSPALALYLLRLELERRSVGAPWLFSCWDRVTLVNDFLPNRDQAAILLVDDFVGSGETASGAVAHFRLKYAKNTDEIVVCTLVTQEQAIRRLSGEGVAVLAPHVRKRGITDSTRLSDVAVGLRLMDDIERTLKVSAKYKRGYGQAEALVSMARCPNNTFPVYWWSGKRRPPPFSR